MHTHGTWGLRKEIFEPRNGEYVGEIHHLILDPHQQCSYHSHQAKWNLFYCLAGSVGIKTDKGYTTWLKPGEKFQTSPLEKHRFMTGEEATQIVEVAYVRFDPHDINREELGGPVKPDMPFGE